MSDQNPTELAYPRENTSKDWNYVPDLPLTDPSIFSRPMDIGLITRWFRRNWLSLSERVLLLLLVIAAYYLLYPSLESAKIFAIAWIAQTYLVNLAIVFSCAGGLHWYFYMRKKQGLRLKFDHRDQTRSNRSFKFSDQVKDNMFWTMTSGVGQLTAFQVITMWLMANGYAPVITLEDNPVWLYRLDHSAAGLVGVSFLLGAQTAAYAVFLHAVSCPASSKHQYWPMVGHVDAPG